MFLQNVGQKSKKSKAKNADSEPLLPGKSADESQAARTPVSAKSDSISSALAAELKEAVEITHREGGPGIPRDVLLSFLKGCREAMQKDANVQVVVNVHEESGIALSSLCMEFQRVVMVNDYGIEPNYGCKYLAKVPVTLPDDEELCNASAEFVGDCMFFFLAALRARGKRHTGPPITSGEIPTPYIQEFFEGCNVLYQEPAVKTELRRIYRETGKPPNEKTVELQRSLLEAMGYDADYACSVLNKLGVTHGQDRLTQMKFQQFAMGAQTAVKMACMTDSELETYMKMVPVFMRYNPHLFEMEQQKRRMMAQQAQQQGHGHGHHGHAQGVSGMGPSSEQMKQLQAQMMAQLEQDPERKAKVMEVQKKVASMTEDLRDELATMLSNEKKAFLQKFVMSPTMKKVNASMDPIKRMDTFASMTDEEMRDMVKFQKIIATDGPALGINVPGAGRPAAGAAAGGGGGIMGALSGMMSNLGLGGGGSSHDHSHSHSHSHGHGHSHGVGPSMGPSVGPPGPTAGQTMER